MNRLAPETLTVQVPFALRKRGGRKIMVMSQSAPVERVRVDNTLVKALARAFRWKKMIDSGAFLTIGDLAAHEKMPPSYMTRVMRLTMLSPAIVEAIVAGQYVNGLAELMEPFPAEWCRQNQTLPEALAVEKCRRGADTTNEQLHGIGSLPEARELPRHRMLPEVGHGAEIQKA